MRPVVALALAALLAPSVANATTALARSLEEMAEAADVVALARVERTEAFWRGRRILTRVDLEPRTVLKGRVDGPLRVETEGGVIDGLGQDVAGAARFTAGEEVAVFLEAIPGREGPTVYRVVGMAQGKLRIEPHTGGPQVVRDDLDRLRLVAPDGLGGLRPVEGPPARQPLADFVRDVSGALAPPASP